MKVLVVVASKYGSTAGIGERIAGVLRGRGVEVDVAAPEAVDAIDGYGAFVIGSAVYMGHWMKPAIEFVERSAADIGARPVWLYSSGPIGDPPRPEERTVDTTAIEKVIRAREHRVFAGRISRHELGFAEKAIAMALRVPDGDYRDWEEIERWASGIADALAA